MKVSMHETKLGANWKFGTPSWKWCNIRTAHTLWSSFVWARSFTYCLAVLDFGEVLSNHSVVPSSRTVRTCSPWGGRWIGQWKTTSSTVGPSAPYSQSAEEAIPHLYKQERKRPTPMRRRLSRTQAFLGRVIRVGAWRCLESKCGDLWGCPLTPRFINDFVVKIWNEIANVFPQRLLT